MTEHEQIDTSSNLLRGMGQRSLDLIKAMHTITAAAQPITGRGVGYKLFTAPLIPSVSRRKCSGSIACLRKPANTTSSLGVDRRREPRAGAHPQLGRSRRIYALQSSIISA